jgi:diguanylate cyclase (GGDEF)-like protein
MKKASQPHRRTSRERVGLSTLRLLFVDSRVGRQLVAMFLVAALFPVSVMGVVLYLRMAEVLKTSQEAEIAQTVQAYEAIVHERLLRIDDGLRSAARGGAPAHDGDSAGLRVGGAIKGVAVLDGSGAIVSAHGTITDRPELRRLATATGSGKARVQSFRSGNDAGILLARRLATDESNRIVVANIDPAFLWGAASLAATFTEFCVATAENAYLHCTDPAVTSTAPLFGLRGGEASRDVRWTYKDTPMLATSRRLSVEPKIDGEPWVITAVRSEVLAEQTTRSFRLFAILSAALAALIALFLSLRQLRVILWPLDRLLAGARSIADRDFGARIRVTSQDEFGRVASAFNAMAERLGVHFHALHTFSEIDKTILTSPDIGKVAKLAIDTLKQVTHADDVSLGVCESGGAGQLRIYRYDGGDGELAPAQEIAWNPNPKLFADRNTCCTWTDRPPLPNGYLKAIRIDEETRLFVQPIARNRRIWGLIVLEQRAPRDLAAHQASLIRDIADRLAVALATAERDRRLHELAHLDGLTGLPNRQRLLSILDHELAAAGDKRKRIGVLFIDLDRFKETNDTLGHAAGDTLLKRTAERIRDTVRDADQVGRHGGDEFVVLLRDVAAATDAGSVASKLVSALAKPFEVEGHNVYVGASIGVAIFPDDGRTASELLKKADTAMYQAKEEGRGRVAFFKQSMNIEMNRRVTLDRELRQALERGEFTLFFQPQIDLRAGRICSAEALLRWRHPTRGILAPSHFIELCEDTGLIEKLGAWVMREACQQHGRWRTAGINIPRVAVNVSSRQLRQREFVPTVDYTMLATKMAPDSLEVEVTESMILDGGEIAISALRALERSGARVAIDDFGTGYSSFTYLKTLPASILKLDKSFVADIVTDRDAATIATAIIDMAHTLRKEVVAEGVETFEQLDFLRRAGCEKVQGYLLSPPLPADHLAQLALRSESGGVDAVIEETRRRMSGSHAAAVPTGTPAAPVDGALDAPRPVQPVSGAIVDA